jgi:hypothetical protein
VRIEKRKKEKGEKQQWPSRFFGCDLQTLFDERPETGMTVEESGALCMTNYQLTLIGYDAETDETEHLIKWVRLRPGHLHVFADLPLAEEPQKMANQGIADHDGGLDVILDEEGRLRSARRGLPNDLGEILALWAQQSRKYQTTLDRQGLTLSCSIACLRSITANTVDAGVPIDDGLYKRLQDLYDDLLDIQRQVV